jgi:preprotein translocase subunit Sss1
MPGRVQPDQLKSDLILPWAIQGIMLATLAVFLIVCITFGDQILQPLPEAQRVLLRTVFYVVAILTFPITNLIRYIQLRLNQTMPYSHAKPGMDNCMDAESKAPKKEEVNSHLEQRSRAIHGAVAEAKKRYLVTVIVSMLLIESVGIFGFVMFILGDSFNTLYIFSGLSALGMFLYRPKLDEYVKIVEALTLQKNE